MIWLVLTPLLALEPSVDADLRRFPSHALVQEYLAFNRDYRANLEFRRLLSPHRAHEFDPLMRAAQVRYEIWDALDDVHCACTESGRWEMLERLRSLLGDDAYYQGRMPPPVPLEYFAEFPGDVER